MRHERYATRGIGLIPLLLLLICTSAVAARDPEPKAPPEKIFRGAYLLIKKAKAAANRENRREARRKYEEAHRELRNLKARHPGWNTPAVSTNINECVRALRGLVASSRGRRPNILFCGAQGTIFGSCYLLDTGTKKIVIDCGLFSEEELKKRNLYFPFDPKGVDVCIIGHAHVDHMAKVPLLYKQGFKGLTLSTEPTKEMTKTVYKIINMLRGEVLVPYGGDDIKSALKNMKALNIGKWYDLGDGTRVRLLNTGHILGAVQIEVEFPWEGKKYKLLYAADTRNPHSPLTPGWEPVREADWVLVESVYGNRLHGRFEREFQKFTDLINEAIASNGTILIPTYSIARTQKVIYYIYLLWRDRKLRRPIDVYVDSKIANRITGEHIDHWQYLADPIKKLFASSINPFDFPGMHEGPPPKNKHGSKIIIAPSAMCDEGTSIVKYVKEYVDDKNSVIIFTGFVLPSSLGGRILSRRKEVTIEDETYKVKCKAYKVSAFSGHADQNEIVRWFKQFEHVGMVFVVHGLPDGSAALAHRLHDDLGLKAYVPRFLERVDLIEFLEAPQKPLPRVEKSSSGGH